MEEAEKEEDGQIKIKRKMGKDCSSAERKKAMTSMNRFHAIIAAGGGTSPIPTAP